jgi:hypothetical protein
MMAAARQIVILLLSASIAPSAPFTLPYKSTISSPPKNLKSTAYGHEYVQPINIEEDAPRDIDSFQTWAYNYGIQQYESFVLTSNQPEYGQADVFASTSADIPAGTSVLYVPEELILTSSKAMAELRGPEMNAAEKVLSSINADEELRQYYLMIKVGGSFAFVLLCVLQLM